MPAPIITGTIIPVPQPMEVTYDPQRGKVARQEYQSAGNGLAGLAAAYQRQRLAFTHTPSSAVSRLVVWATGAELGEPETIIDSWEILGNEIQRDVKSAPAFASLTSAQLGKIQAAVDATNGGTPTAPDVVAGSLTIATALYDLLVQGTTQYALGQYVLRHSTNVAANYAANIADANIEKTYTTAQLTSEVTDASLWTFPMPGRLVYKIQNIPAPTAKTNFLWGWRKLPSTETTDANNRIRITTEYWLEHWSLYIYPAVT